MRNDHRLRVATVGLEAGGPCAGAALLGTGEALPAGAAAPPTEDEDRVADGEPRSAQVRQGIRAGGVDVARYLVAQGERQLDARLRAVDDVEVRVAHPAR